MNAASILHGLQSEPLGWLAIALFGAALGGLVDRLIESLPQGRPPALRPACAHCGRPVALREALPLLGFFLSAGRCRRCGGAVPLRRLLIECLGMLLCIGVLLQSRTLGFAVLRAGFVLALLAVIFVDYDHRIIPDVITLPGIAVGLAAAFFGFRGLGDALLGALTGAGALLLVAGGYWLATRREGLGMGDVKLMAMVGAFLGWQGALGTLMLGSLAGAAVGGVLILRGRGHGGTALPFGSFLAPAAWVVLLAGEPLWQAYLRLMLR